MPKGKLVLCPAGLQDELNSDVAVLPALKLVFVPKGDGVVVPNRDVVPKLVVPAGFGNKLDPAVVVPIGPKFGKVVAAEEVGILKADLF